ncbi:phosphocarrier protein [Bifidobacterium bohemicum]|uniref:Phosphocarrier protein HPr n=1 Tax=Bifidobacterium bohemicum DSM 22767 TaxID=1437606 RepID=A0A086ZF29_9BIFI|nr:HPr family phosphocarrier protein [Bifidobacterium bohemicum]KFI45129.1 phosphocarrier protein HPr [Bifidobacterium bohemicum DSM 22767]SCB90818.1 phosphocarrier protein [Bifidobacterium bohemicum]
MASASRTVVITDPVGIHARPASQFAQAAAASGCKVTISKEPGTQGVNGASILSVMGLGIKKGDSVEVVVDGDNAEAVAQSLSETLTAEE